jgi:hypothetical protein
MGRPNFEPVLHFPDPGHIAAIQAAHGEKPGPHAEGPVGDGKVLTWVYVWIIQNGPNGEAAAAYGESPEKDKIATTVPTLSEEELPPFRGTWKIRTEMSDPSDKFIPGTPALATAMALVQYDEGGGKEIDWWSEPIMIDDPESGGTSS